MEHTFIARFFQISRVSPAKGFEKSIVWRPFNRQKIRQIILIKFSAAAKDCRLHCSKRDHGYISVP